MLSEKPLVTRVEDAKRLAAAAARAGRIVHTVHNWLEAPICRKISALIDEGAIGAVRIRPLADTQNPAGDRRKRGRGHKLARRSGDGGWRHPVRPRLACALLRHALGRPLPFGVAARLETRRFHEQPLEDTASVDLDTTAGVSHIFLTWAADERSNAIEIDGDQGEIRVIGDAVVVKSSSLERRWFCPPSLSEGSHHPDWFGGVAADFLAAATGGAKSNLDEAILCAQLIDAAQRSSAAGGVQTLSTRISQARDVALREGQSF